MTATSDRPALAPRTTSAGDAGPTSQGDARVDVAALEKTLLGRWADLRAAAKILEQHSFSVSYKD